MRTVLLGCVLSALALGCSSDRDAVEKRLAGLRDEITRLQSQNDRLMERVEALESRPAPAAASSSASAPRAERPALKTVRLFPGESAPTPSEPEAAAEPPAEERPDAPGSRPVIRVRGRQDDDTRGGTRRSARADSTSGEER